MILSAILAVAAIAGAGTHLPAGLQELPSTLVVTAKDSGRVIEGAEDGSTVLSAGFSVTGWHQKTPGVWSAPIPKDEKGELVWFDSLFVSGRRAQRARIPNEGYVQVEACTQVLHQVGSPTASTWLLRLKPEERKIFAALDPVDFSVVQGICHAKWGVMHRPVTAYNAQTGELSLDGDKQPPHYGEDPNEQYAFENVRSGFDQSGEWYYDKKNGEVLYRPLPGEKLDEVIAPKPGFATLVRMENVTNVVFRNITFAYTSPANHPGPFTLGFCQAAAPAPYAVELHHAQGIRFENCRFVHTGAHALVLDEDCRSNVVTHCTFEDIGAGGVRIGSYAWQRLAQSGAVVQPPAKTAFNEVSDCVLRQGGRTMEPGVGILIVDSSDNLITHNEIGDFYYTGISVGWKWGYDGSYSQRNEISFNYIHDIGQRVLSDMGGVYTLGTSFGTTISNNVIQRVDAYSYGGWGLYNDEGSEGIVMENNLVTDTKDALYHQHYGRNNLLKNNILAFSREGEFAVTRVEDHLSVTVENNIFYWEEGDFFVMRYKGASSGRARIVYTNNLYECESGKGTFAQMPFEEWQLSGKGDATGHELNVGFINPKRRDFHLRPHSPALKYGFKPWDFSTVGPRK